MRPGRPKGVRMPASRPVSTPDPLARADPAYLFDLACADAFQARLDKSAAGPPAAAVKALQAAVKEGLDNAYKLEHDDRLAPLRSRKDFQELIRLVKGKTPTAPVQGDAPEP